MSRSPLRRCSIKERSAVRDVVDLVCAHTQRLGIKITAA
jgi:hypothetical protein